MKPRWIRFGMNVATLAMLGATACTDAGEEPGRTMASSGPERPDLFRAPAIPNVVDGVAWEAGNWEPHLPAGPEGVSWGNHRAVVVVESNRPISAEGSNDQAGAAPTNTLPEAVMATIPWRRRDADPASKAVIVVDATTGEAVRNAIATRIENASGDVVFQPNPDSSEYHVYYLPWQSTGGYYPTITYPTPAELREAVRGTGSVTTAVGESPSRAQASGAVNVSWAGLGPDPEARWEGEVQEANAESLPRARTTHIQSVDDFHSFFPMEVIATPEEEARFWTAVPRGENEEDATWALIPEHRDRPVRMKHFLPLLWTEAVTDSFSGQVLRDEYFTFQLAVVTEADSVTDLQVSFQGFPRAWSETLTCFNCEGIDEKGIPFTKTIDVSAGTVLPLWIGLRVPESQPPGLVDGTVTVTSANGGSRSIRVYLDVQADRAYDGGADDPDLQTRLAWLNSTVGTDPDFIIEPFEPVRFEELDEVSDEAEQPVSEASDPLAERSSIAGPVFALSVLGRRVELGPSGLPSQIFSYFTPELTHFAEVPEPILARPMMLEVVTPGFHVEEFIHEPFEIRQEARGRAEWTVQSTSDYLDMTVDGAMEYDGMLDYSITLVATSDAAIDDVGLPISLVPDAAEYMLGLGRKGGKRPDAVDWKWAVENHQEGVWLGGVHKGLQYVLRDNNYVRPLNTNFYRNQPLNMPPSWFNDGRGGIQIIEEVGRLEDVESPEEEEGPRIIAVTAQNYSGPRELAEGDTLHFNIRFLITPFKSIDTGAHFNTRFVHQYVPVDSVRAWGGTVVNIHHANEINPFINYPFFNLDLQTAYIEEAHEKGIKVKLYNTIRELTYKAHELFPMRSFGDEILNDGEGGGHSWMQEHLENDYHSAWHAARVDDAAMLNKGTSRWTNYYVEGINWLAKNQEIDGLYLDDIAFSRETVKRLTTVLDQNRPDVVIDLHSANQFNVRDGFTNSAMLYMEHFPFISRLWFGEYFEYDLDEDYWMTEVSGLPFGLMGEMLQDGGHPYRGLLYGMTGRKYGRNDPRPVWEMMSDFGISSSRMLGYWLADTPVTTDHPRILATTYSTPGKALVVLASWSDADEVVALAVDWEALGAEAPPGTDSISEPRPGTPDTVAAAEEDSTEAVGQNVADTLPGTPLVRAYAPAVEGLQPESEIDLTAVSVPAGQGLFLIIEWGEAG